MPAPAVEVIRSSGNQLVRYVRSLQRRSTRQAERAFVVEGRRAVFDALEAGARSTWLLLREGEELPEIDPAIPVRVIGMDLFDKLGDTVHPQGVLGVFPFPDLPMTPDASPLFLVVDRIRDPGNLGTLLRSAAAVGVSAVYLSAKTVDPFNPKVVRAGMGAHFRVPIRGLDGSSIAELRRTAAQRILADLGAFPAYDQVDWRQPAALIVASEADGPDADARSLSTGSVTIPMPGGMESLNAAVAGSIILFEAMRQRRAGSDHVGGVT
jgi:TrmH family RNA methyltransferase